MDGLDSSPLLVPFESEYANNQNLKIRENQIQILSHFRSKIYFQHTDQ